MTNDRYGTLRNALVQAGYELEYNGEEADGSLDEFLSAFDGDPGRDFHGSDMVGIPLSLDRFSIRTETYFGQKREWKKPVINIEYNDMTSQGQIEAIMRKQRDKKNLHPFFVVHDSSFKVTVDIYNLEDQEL